MSLPRMAGTNFTASSRPTVPILLFCNVSDIIPSTEVVITTRQGDVLDWNPCLSLQDGTVNTPWNLGGGVWDLTRYEKEPFEG